LVVIIPSDAAAGGLAQVSQNFQQGGFARSIDALQPNRLSGLPTSVQPLPKRSAAARRRQLVNN
jgi:hypothetical protein